VLQQGRHLIALTDVSSSHATILFLDSSIEGHGTVCISNLRLDTTTDTHDSVHADHGEWLCVTEVCATSRVLPAVSHT
jgi:hypothetical protein